MYPLGLAAAAKGLGNLRPDRPHRPQLGNLHKEIGTHREAEHYLPGSLVRRQSPLQHGTHIVRRYGQGVGNFLHIVGAAPAEHIAASHKGLQAWRIFNRPLCRQIGLIVQLGQGLAVPAPGSQLTDRIGAHNAL